jgi:hypothetical protein
LLAAFVAPLLVGPVTAPSAGATTPSTGATGTVHWALSSSVSSSLVGHSYSLLTTSGQLVGLGAAISASASTPPQAPLVGVAATPDGKGAWGVESNGAIETFGDAPNYGSMAGRPLSAPVVGMAATPTGGGYWEVASDGGIFTFGNAAFMGSMGAVRLNEPVVGMAATPTGGGYWEVASDGGIFTFGNAAFMGSMGAVRLNEPVVGMAATPTGGGYWEVASDGGIFTFGDAPFYGSGASTQASFAGMAVEVGGYQNPFRTVTGLSPQRVDQGVDYAGSGPIYAIGDGVVLSTTNSGWPGGAFIAYELVDGPAAGDIVYVAENVVPKVKIGEAVTSRTVVGTLIDAAPNLETGWGAPPPLVGESLAREADQWSTLAETNSLPTAYGANFSELLGALGAPSGIFNGPVQGSLPSTWPEW